MNNNARMLIRLTMLGAIGMAAGCAVNPKQDPRAPAMTETPVGLTVCYIGWDDDEREQVRQERGEPDAHLMVGDMLIFDTNRLGRLRVRHEPGEGNTNPPWNDGDDIKVRSTILAEMVDPRGQETNTRRFVPVGRFKVRTDGHRSRVPYDFLASKTVAFLDPGPDACEAEIGDDEVLLRAGGHSNDRHGGHIILR